MNQQYWSPSKIESAISNSKTLCPLRIIVGPNRIGKTYGCVIKVVDTIKDGYNALWIRMFDEEFKGEFIQNFINILHTIDETLNLVQCEQGILLDGVQRIYFRSLNVFGKARGNGSTTGQTTLVILDEFIPEDGRVPRKGIYLPLMALIRTFTNYSPLTKCYCLANCITPFSDLFCSLRVFPSPEKDITIYEDKGVAIEVCRGYQGVVEKDSPWIKVAVAGKMPAYREFEGHYIDEFVYSKGTNVPNQTCIKYNEEEYLICNNNKNVGMVWTLAKRPPTGVKPLCTDGDVKGVYFEAKIRNAIKGMFYKGNYRFYNFNVLSRFLDSLSITL